MGIEGYCLKPIQLIAIIDDIEEVSLPKK